MIVTLKGLYLLSKVMLFNVFSRLFETICAPIVIV